MKCSYLEKSVTHLRCCIDPRGDDFDGCDFHGVFFGVDFSYCLFSQCNFERAKFVNCQFNSSEFDTASDIEASLGTENCDFSEGEMTREEFLASTP